MNDMLMLKVAKKLSISIKRMKTINLYVLNLFIQICINIHNIFMYYKTNAHMMLQYTPGFLVSEWQKNTW